MRDAWPKPQPTSPPSPPPFFALTVAVARSVQAPAGASIGAVVAIALVGAVIARSRLPAIDPETSAAGG
ncbi:hypothetical protein [Rhizobium leguminosarum]|uniref:hypothetical protein n=1 Tax=Rhizobium leguminosarum TaxID=384 RepID=UPI001FDF97AC|nr:hypothetical protein [Rhizobium leguminosarum]